MYLVKNTKIPNRSFSWYLNLKNVILILFIHNYAFKHNFVSHNINSKHSIVIRQLDNIYIYYILNIF